MFGNPETTTGGKALKFYASLRLDIRRIGPVKERETVIGNHVRVKVVKNKVAPPFRQAEFDVMFDEGISHTSLLVDLASEANIIQKSGAWYSYGDQRIGQGRENAKLFLRDNPPLHGRGRGQGEGAARHACRCVGAVAEDARRRLSAGRRHGQRRSCPIRGVRARSGSRWTGTGSAHRSRSRPWPAAGSRWAARSTPELHGRSREAADAEAAYRTALRRWSAARSRGAISPAGSSQGPSARGGRRGARARRVGRAARRRGLRPALRRRPAARARPGPVAAHPGPGRDGGRATRHRPRARGARRRRRDRRRVPRALAGKRAAQLGDLPPGPRPPAPVASSPAWLRRGFTACARW